MKKRIKNFGFVFPIDAGKHKGKFAYCYKDKEGLNQHSKVFKDVRICSQEFANEFLKHLLSEIDGFIKDK